jgi:hypothetical protein
MELVLIGLGGCSAYDVVDILEKGREAIESVVVELEADRAEQVPKVFTRIHLHYVVKGRGLKPEKVERAIALSVEKILLGFGDDGQNRCDHSRFRGRRHGRLAPPMRRFVLSACAETRCRRAPNFGNNPVTLSWEGRPSPSTSKGTA